jgi:hypothetical protein
MDPDQTARMRRLVWIHAGRKPIMLVLSWRGSYSITIILQGLKWINAMQNLFQIYQLTTKFKDEERAFMHIDMCLVQK